MKSPCKSGYTSHPDSQTNANQMTSSPSKDPSSRIYYGWWIVVAAFLNLFFVVGIIFYGFPVFYPHFVESLGFTRAQVTQGFFLGFLLAGVPFGVLAGAVIDRFGAKFVILTGVALVGVPLVLMGFMTRFWQFELLCIVEVVGFVLAGPIPNQVLIARWFRQRRGRAMGYAYLGLGMGGVVAPLSINRLTLSLGWRHALEFVGALILLVLFPLGIWVTRSAPEEFALFAESLEAAEAAQGNSPVQKSVSVMQAVRSRAFWLLLAASTLVVGAIGAVVQHFILFLKDEGYSATSAARFSTILLASSLGGRVIVGYLADRFPKTHIMACFYFLIGASVFLLGNSHSPVALGAFAIIFGFSMGADYMLIPLVAAECFGTASLGKLLALIIMGYSIGQWAAPWIVGRIFDVQHSYSLAWKIIALAGVLGAASVYAIPTSSRLRQL